VILIFICSFIAIGIILAIGLVGDHWLWSILIFTVYCVVCSVINFVIVD